MATESSSYSYTRLVPLLNGTNYATWATKMEMLLIRERLWAIVAERRPRPQPSGAAGPATRNTGRDAGNDEEIAKWEDDAERATSTIFLHLDERAEKHVQSLREPVAIWKKLKDIYERRGFSARFYLWQKLFTLQIADYRKNNGDDKAMELYIDAFRSHCQQLRSSGAEISNEIEASVLLNGLDNGFESFLIATTQAFRQNDDAEIDVENLIMQLTDETRRRTEMRNGSSSGNNSASTPTGLHHSDALVASGRGRGKRGRDESCNHCKKPGHVQDDCWTKYPEKKPKRFRGAGESAALHAHAVGPVNGDSWGVGDRPLL